MNAHLERPIRALTSHCELNDVVAGFPAASLTLRMRRASGYAHVVPMQVDSARVLVAKQLDTRYVIQVIPQAAPIA